jgi:hypothetical protein
MIYPSPDNKGIVWLASYPKSGNTWLRVFLYHLVRLQNGAPREEDELNQLDRASGYEGRMFGLFAEFLDKPISEASVEETASVRPYVHAAIAKRMPNIALLKTHTALADIAGAPQINLAVTVGAVYMVRDPRDIALSLAHHLGIGIDETIEVMASTGFSTANSSDGIFEAWGSWSEHVASWTGTPSDPLLVVRYEDLSADPAGTFTKITRHLRQEASPAAIAEATELATFDKLASAEKIHPFKETSERADRFFREGRAGAWRDKLTAAQAERIVAAHGPQMERMGYPRD